jgi:hypothetical protein
VAGTINGWLNPTLPLAGLVKEQRTSQVAPRIAIHSLIKHYEVKLDQEEQQTARQRILACLDDEKCTITLQSV